MEHTAKGLSAEELKAINAFTRREFREEDVYVFPVILCDNDIDRDFERFSDEALEALSKLYVGVTGIADHQPASSNQSARIFSCRTETVAGRQTSDGKPYRRLCAKAYLPKSEKNEELILALDSGIRKEVSVGCAVRRRICSVCGEDIAMCQHQKGKRYDGQLCFATLQEPIDAYEWSFVAVPAQKNAGVIKCFQPPKIAACGGRKGEPYQNMEVEKKLFAGEEQHFSAEEMQSLAERFKELEKKAFDGECYRDKLTKELKGLAAVALPGLSSETLGLMAKSLSVRQLDELKTAFEARTADLLPLHPQLASHNSKTGGNHNTIYQNI